MQPGRLITRYIHQLCVFHVCKYCSRAYFLTSFLVFGALATPVCLKIGNLLSFYYRCSGCNAEIFWFIVMNFAVLFEYWSLLPWVMEGIRMYWSRTRFTVMRNNMWLLKYLGWLCCNFPSFFRFCLLSSSVNCWPVISCLKVGCMNSRMLLHLVLRQVFY